jgi:hypothetical protein
LGIAAGHSARQSTDQPLEVLPEFNIHRNTCLKALSAQKETSQSHNSHRAGLGSGSESAQGARHQWLMPVILATQEAEKNRGLKPAWAK